MQKKRRRLTLEDMKALAKSRGGECLSTIYVSSSKKLLWKCAEGHEWLATSNYIRNDHTWCPFCSRRAPRKIEEAYTKANFKGGECLSSGLIKTCDKLHWRCAQNHEWLATFQSVVNRGSWCPYCVGKNITITDVQSFAASKGGECLSSIYINSGSNLLWRCHLGHEWQANFRNVKHRESWCPHCAQLIPLTIADAQKAAIKKNGVCLSTTIVHNSHDKLLWRCEFGHEWQAALHSVRNGGQWCPHCHKLSDHTYEEFIKIAKERGGKLLSDKYNPKQKLVFRCVEGHKFEINGRHVFQGAWCKICSGHVHDLEYCKAIAKSSEGQCLTTEYSTKLPVMWRCREGHIWEAPVWRASLVWCPQCAREKTKAKRFSLLKEIARSYGGKCLSTEWVTHKTKMTWQCKFGHKWEAAPMGIKAGRWCPKCRHHKEAICREIFERIFSCSFLKCRPIWLRSSKGYRMELDGYSEVLKIAFEYQGAQHYMRVPFYFDTIYKKQKVLLTEDQFEAQKRRDQEKRELCKANGVTLIEIPWSAKDLCAFIQNALNLALNKATIIDKLGSEEYSSTH